MNFIKPFKGIRYPSNEAATQSNGKSSAINLLLSNLENKITCLKSLLAHNKIYQEGTPSFYLYKISGMNAFVGLIALVNVDDIHKKIHFHEKTLQDRVHLYAKSFAKERLQINPVLLLHKNSQTLSDLFNKIMLSAPDQIITTENNPDKHELWIINEPNYLTQIIQIYNNLTEYYLADGHHRAEAAKMLASDLNYQKSGHFLSVLSSENYINIKSFNRLINKFVINENFYEKLANIFYITPIEKPSQQPSKGEYYLGVNDRWLSLKLNTNNVEISHSDHIDQIAINKFFFQEILKIEDQADHKDLLFIPESVGLEFLHEKINSREAKAALCIPALNFNDFTYVAKNKIILPPNSTWFEPKILDGLVSYSYD